MDEVKKLIEHSLNPQTELLWEWRDKLLALLTQPLSSTASDADADGEEFTRSIETQGEAEAYLQAYTDLFADRRAALTAERTLLAAHDTKEAHLRKTKAAQKATDAVYWAEEEAVTDVQMEKLEEGEVQPQHEVLQKELKEKRTALLQLNSTGTSRAIKSAMVDLSNVAARIVREGDPEKANARETMAIANEAVAMLRTLISDQGALSYDPFERVCSLVVGKLMDKIQLDLVLLRKTFNDRIS